MALSKLDIREKYKKHDEFMAGESGRHVCACGCNLMIDLKKSHFWNGIPKFIFGHAARLRVGTIQYDDNQFYSVRDIARIGDVSEQTVRLWMRQGSIVTAKTVGRKNLFVRKDIDAFLADRKHRVPFDKNMFVTVSELKRMGVSRRKLRKLVRDGDIMEPRIYRRETHYYRPEIEKFLDVILEDVTDEKLKKRVDQTVIEDLMHRIRALEARIDALETLRKR